MKNSNCFYAHQNIQIIEKNALNYNVLSSSESINYSMYMIIFRATKTSES